MGNQDELCARHFSALGHGIAPQYFAPSLTAIRMDTATQTQSNTSYECRVPRKNAITTGGSKHQRASTNSSLSGSASARANTYGRRRKALTCPAVRADHGSTKHSPRGSGTGRLTRSYDPHYRRCRARWVQRSRACAPRPQAPGPRGEAATSRAGARDPHHALRQAGEQRNRVLEITAAVMLYYLVQEQHVSRRSRGG
jgi:hypothetical protein